MSTDAPSKSDVEIGDYKYGFHDSTDFYAFKSRKGLDAEIVSQISGMKNEPEWMLEFRLKSLEIFESRPCRTGAVT
jgi:Fe-S cluster assembly protein SufB